MSQRYPAPSAHTDLIGRIMRQPRSTPRHASAFIAQTLAPIDPVPHPVEQSSLLLPLTISAADVRAARIERTLNTLFSLTDCPSKTLRYRQRMRLRFSGYSNDPRELHQITEVRHFIQQIEHHWNFWLHFLCPEPDIVATILLLGLPLPQPMPAPSTAQIDPYSFCGVITDAQHLWHRLDTLTHATLHLQHACACPDTLREAHARSLSLAVSRVINPRPAK